MEFLRTWIVPPLIGAAIGYFTNWLAIKMLFRPLKPVMIGSWKLPFTPGILPRERERLSVSIGETVSRELLTTQVFDERLHDPYMIGKVETSVSVLLEGVLSAPVQESLAPILKKERSESEKPEPDLGSLALRISKKALSSPGFRSSLSLALTSSAEEILALPASALVSRETLEKAVFSFAQNCGKPEFRARVENLVFAKLMSQTGQPEPAMSHDHGESSSSASGTAQEPILSEKQLAPLVVLASDVLYEKLVPVANSILEDEAIQKELETLAMKAVKGAINRLGPIQRLIVTAANYEKTLQNSMPETIEELSKAISQLLASQTMKEKLVKAVAGYIAALRYGGSAQHTLIGTTTEGLGWVLQAESAFGGTSSRPSASAASDAVSGDKSDNTTSDELKSSINSAAHRDVLKVFESADRFLQELSDDAEGFSRRLAAHYASFSDRNVSELLPVLSADLAEGLTRIIVDGIENPGAGSLVSGVLKAFAEGFLEANAGKTLKELLAISQDDIAEISRLVTRTVLNALSAQSEQLLDALDIKTMVVEKIDALDMADVERIILSVVQNELSWITFLGGVLGALIGLVQSLVSLL